MAKGETFWTKWRRRLSALVAPVRKRLANAATNKWIAAVHAKFKRTVLKLTGMGSYLELLLFIGFFVALIVVLFVFVFVAFTGRLPYFDGLGKLSDLTEWDDFRSLAFGAAGIVGAAFGLFQLYNSAVRTRFNAQDAETRKRDADTSVERERNERFVRASELLAHKDETISMAGVFALERLAMESDSYTQTCVDVLAGFVRERTNREDYPPRPPDDWKPDEPAEDEKDTRSEDEKECEQVGGWGRPTEPIRAAITALSKVCRYQTEDRKNRPIRVDLRGAQLNRLRIENEFMRCWRLEGANFQCAVFSGIDLKDAELSHACLDGTAFTGSDFRDSLCSGTSFINACFEFCFIERARITRSILDGAYFASVFFFSAKVNKKVSSDSLDIQPIWILQNHKLDNIVWRQNAPPAFPNYIDQSSDEAISALDKRWCSQISATDKDGNKLPDRPDLLHPDLLDENGNYKGVPSGFRERREAELRNDPSGEGEA